MGIPRRAFLVAFAALIWLSGCAVGPDYAPPVVPLPKAFGTASLSPAVASASAMPDYVRWWQVLRDPQLERLIDRAVAGNPDVEIALTRVQEARLQQNVVFSSMLPDVGGGGGIATGSAGDLMRSRAGLILRAGDSTRGFRAISRMAGFDSSWELDLFGKLQRSFEAASDGAEKEAELRNATLITVIADVARNYLEIRALQMRLEIARKDVATVQRTIELAVAKFGSGSSEESKPEREGKSSKKESKSSKEESKLQDEESKLLQEEKELLKEENKLLKEETKLLKEESKSSKDESKSPKQESKSSPSDGTAKPGAQESKQDSKSSKQEGKSSKQESKSTSNELNLALARSELATQQARLPELESEIAAAESRLAVLLGVYEADIAGTISGPSKLPALPGRLRPGAPVELLRRRPDIRAAERELAAATARIGVATADLFPSVTLTSGFGGQGTIGRTTSTPLVTGPIWSVGPGVDWPLLDFGRLDALIDIQELRTHEVLVRYKKTVIAAVAEVNQDIRQYLLDLQRWKALNAALEAIRHAAAVTMERYERGDSDFRAFLDAQRRKFALEEQTAIAAKNAVLRYVAFYKALGGGWEPFDELPPLPPVQPAVAAGVSRLTSGWHGH